MAGIGSLVATQDDARIDAATREVNADKRPPRLRIRGLPAIASQIKIFAGHFEVLLAFTVVRVAGLFISVDLNLRQDEAA
jgi:hypothetical protein